MNITLDDIRSKAPDGATHYAYYDLGDFTKTVYYKYVNCNLHVYSSIYDEWKLDEVKKTVNFKSRLKPL